jgi:hypothetical protein
MVSNHLVHKEVASYHLQKETMLEFWLRSPNREHISTEHMSLGDGAVTISDRL